MTQEDEIAFKEFLGGAVIAVVITVVLLSLIFASGIVSVGDTELKPSQPTEPTVVDTYENCDIIRWSSSSMAEYKYFLKCNE